MHLSMVHTGAKQDITLASSKQFSEPYSPRFSTFSKIHLMPGSYYTI